MTGKVVWVIDENNIARELYQFLHLNWQGGYQAYTEELGNAILRSEAPTTIRNRGDAYLQQMREVNAQLQESINTDDGFESIHLQHLADTWAELDNAIAAGEMPREWKQQFYDAREH